MGRHAEFGPNFLGIFCNMSVISQNYRLWQVKRYERKRAEAIRKQQSVALGFAWPAPNIGGVRRHLESIEKYSSYPVALYPSNYASTLLGDGAERSIYQQNLDKMRVVQHSVFHSHVDPRFIRVSRQAQEHGIPWVHTYHTLYFEEHWDYKLQPWQIEINDCLLQEARHADVCLSVSSWLVDWLNENHGIESQFLPNGVDLKACDHADRDRFIEKYGITDFVLFVGSLSKIKNPLAFIEAAGRCPDIEFVMIGTDLSNDAVKRYFDLDIPVNLKLLGPLPHDQTMDAMAACKVFVMTSYSEGQPTVLLEAMSMRKFCVVPALHWCNDVVTNDSFGLKYSQDNIADLREKIEKAFDATPSDAVRQFIESRFSWPVVVKQLDNIYSNLLTQKNR